MKLPDLSTDEGVTAGVSAMMEEDGNSTSATTIINLVQKQDAV